MKAKKILVLGVDGMDPRFTKFMLDNGELPNIQTYLNRGAAREDLVMLGGVPTITPPMWTTLATGATPATHGITCFWNQHPDKLDTLVYALDSRECKAEQLWNVFAESGKKTLVWHWPGSSWPPSSDSPNLSVVEGTQPPGIHNGIASVDKQILMTASTSCENLSIEKAKDVEGGAGCVIEGMELEEESGITDVSAAESVHYLFSHEEGEASAETLSTCSQYHSPLKPASGWTIDVPKDTKEFTMLTCEGKKRYPCLLLKNESGFYDQVAVYKNKKQPKPWFTAKDGEFINEFIEEIITADGNKVPAAREASIVKLDRNGNYLEFWFSTALQTNVAPVLWHPQNLYQEIIENVGYVPSTISSCGFYPELIERRTLPSWDYYQKWQAKALMYLIKEHQYEIVFSHIHNVDAIGHHMWRYVKKRSTNNVNSPEIYQEFMKEVYRQTDEYLGNFLPLLDEGWTIFITSDHGLLSPLEDEIPLLGEGFGVNMGVMLDLGYTVLKKDENGKDTKEIDWTKTTAVAPRGNHIYINLKGRNSTGIVDEKDKYALETKIIDDLYSYRVDGKRVIKLAIRNKDAVIFGLTGPGCGDIIYFVEEGFNRLHGDSWATTYGVYHTSVSPIFIAAGQGIKEGYKTDRAIHEVDFAPTLAAVAQVRMPAQCEGAPVYQILNS